MQISAKGNQLKNIRQAIVIFSFFFNIMIYTEVQAKRFCKNLTAIILFASQTIYLYRVKV
jgi:hypothetical protein